MTGNNPKDSEHFLIVHLFYIMDGGSRIWDYSSNSKDIYGKI